MIVDQNSEYLSKVSFYLAEILFWIKCFHQNFKFLGDILIVDQNLEFLAEKFHFFSKLLIKFGIVIKFVFKLCLQETDQVRDLCNK